MISLEQVVTLPGFAPFTAGAALGEVVRIETPSSESGQHLLEVLAGQRAPIDGALEHTARAWPQHGIVVVREGDRLVGDDDPDWALSFYAAAAGLSAEHFGPAIRAVLGRLATGDPAVLADPSVLALARGLVTGAPLWLVCPTSAPATPALAALVRDLVARARRGELTLIVGGHDELVPPIDVDQVWRFGPSPDQRDDPPRPHRARQTPSSLRPDWHSLYRLVWKRASCGSEIALLAVLAALVPPALLLTAIRYEGYWFEQGAAVGLAVAVGIASLVVGAVAAPAAAVACARLLPTRAMVPVLCETPLQRWWVALFGFAAGQLPGLALALASAPLCVLAVRAGALSLSAATGLAAVPWLAATGSALVVAASSRVTRRWPVVGQVVGGVVGASLACAVAVLVWLA